MKETIINDMVIYRVDVGNKHAQMAFSFRTLKELQAVFGESQGQVPRNGPQAEQDVNAMARIVLGYATCGDIRVF